VLLAVHVAGTAVIALPVAPSPSSPLVAVANGPNPDVGETIGWDRFVAHVRAAASGADAVVTRNYGEAGALEHAGVPEVYSGHNAYGGWGPPPEAARDVAFVGGFDRARLLRWFAACSSAPPFDNGYDLDNEEQGAAVEVCTARLRPWPEIWADVEHLG
jgi:hypothetical protein